ncbi:MAG: sulfurtransferase TusA family protein [Candidatus Helarchaeota archaeon]|nr:sulfurtransferase TusA family protein [Candidatus Helarchaeota archaeon]
MSLNKIRTIDLKGEVCPYTFMLTKLSLEEMNADEILEVTVDYPPAVENIPRSIRDQNLGEILSVEKISKNLWKLTIKKC